ncbi:SGNH/GDSL hydrolase family protein [Kitasatospora kifunensis]|uniref:Lysophospholipase L1-like esterase n=1 Tax=Kitasatospora kifunensis TaxID=58351 RepID=A0A7W7R5Z3_KITKI|nr:SGNH/GDSL hydrolase family protein [Kitasatospora kifunensis]MBB4925925.1 lysophospholipase L1-like esterase [Kitasatospora kifunensis]
MKRLLPTGLAALFALSNAILSLAPPATAGTVSHATARTGSPVLRIMPLGDSITVGQGSITGNGYRADLRDLVTDQTHYGVQFVGDQSNGTMTNPQHEGHGYYMINDVRHGVDGWLAAAQPDVVLLYIGTNDLDWGTDLDPDHAADRLKVLMDQIFTDQPELTVVMEGLNTTTGGMQNRVAQYNNRAAELAQAEQQQGRRLVFTNGPSWETKDFADRLHPNDTGYQKMADAFFPGLQQAAANGWLG